MFTFLFNYMELSNMINESDEENTNISDEENTNQNTNIDKQYINKILCHIGDDVDNDDTFTLNNLNDTLSHFVTDKFPNCQMCHDIHLKYKILINTFTNNLHTVVKTIAIDKQKNVSKKIYDLDKNTIYLFGSIKLYDDITHKNIINKFHKLINICINIVLLTAYWRRDTDDINISFKNSIFYFEELIRDLLIPYIKEIRYFIENASVCEPRILTGHYDENCISVMSNVKSSHHSTESLFELNDITGSRKQISFDELSAIINQSYGNNPDLECSTALDIFASYLRGQKQLHIEAKNYSEKYLNLLSLPAIIISAAVGLLTLILDTRIGFIIIAIMSTLNTIIMSVISLLKLDAKAEAHRTSAYHFDKLETKCSFLSGRIMFDTNGDDITQVIQSIETKINEIKEVNQFVLPEYVRRIYPKTYSSNVFSTVKKLYVDEVILKNNLKNIINDMIVKSRKTNKTPEDVLEIQDLKIAQDKLLNKILAYKKKYLDLDSSLKYEIKNNDYIRKIRAYTCLNIFNMCFCNIFDNCLNIMGPKKPIDYSDDTFASINND